MIIMRHLSDLNRYPNTSLAHTPLEVLILILCLGFSASICWFLSQEKVLALSHHQGKYRLPKGAAP